MPSEAVREKNDWVPTWITGRSGVLVMAAKYVTKVSRPAIFISCYKHKCINTKKESDEQTKICTKNRKMDIQM